MDKDFNKHRMDKDFNEGDWVYVKLRLYRQSSVTSRQSPKLSRRYFGPFQITAKIGKVAYRLALPLGSRIHPVFHVSLLRPCYGDPHSHTTPLPLHTHDDNPVLQPAAILRFRPSGPPDSGHHQVLVSWEGCDSSEATWENLTTFNYSFLTFGKLPAMGLPITPLRTRSKFPRPALITTSVHKKAKTSPIDPNVTGPYQPAIVIKRRWISSKLSKSIFSLSVKHISLRIG